MAFGQERLLVTPLQMAMVAGTIGNGGILMEPHVVDRIVSPKGQVVYRGTATRSTGGHAGDRARRRRDDGRSRAARHRHRGTAPRLRRRRQDGHRGDRRPGINHTWFIAFAGLPKQKPRIAIAVVVENQPHGTAAESPHRSRRPSWRHSYAHAE